MTTTIKFSIAQDGTVTETVEGVKGPSCESLTKEIEDKLGNVESRIHTGEYYTKAQDSELEFIVDEFTHDSEGC